MANIVLVHGRLAWRLVLTVSRRLPLRKMGHEVFTPTHTGIGANALITRVRTSPLETHIRDVAAASGRGNQRHHSRRHSYGGMVITGVAATGWPTDQSARLSRCVRT